MKNTFGQADTLTLFGESHGAAVGAVLDGLAPGLPVDGDFLRRWIPPGRSRTTIRYSAASFRGAPPARR